MDENVSFWSKKPEDLTVKDQIKFIALAPVVSAAVILVPLWVIATVADYRAKRRAKNQTDLTLVEDTDEDE